MKRLQFRISVLSEICRESIYFFVDPDYLVEESLSFLNEMDQKEYGMQSSKTRETSIYEKSVRILEAVIPELSERAEIELQLDEGIVWAIANEITHRLVLRARSKVMKVLRHALSGQPVRRLISETLQALFISSLRR